MLLVDELWHQNMSSTLSAETLFHTYEPPEQPPQTFFINFNAIRDISWKVSKKIVHNYPSIRVSISLHQSHLPLVSFFNFEIKSNKSKDEKKQNQPNDNETSAAICARRLVACLVIVRGWCINNRKKIVASGRDGVLHVGYFNAIHVAIARIPIACTCRAR